jgi:hypothetical protein
MEKAFTTAYLFQSTYARSAPHVPMTAGKKGWSIVIFWLGDSIRDIKWPVGNLAAGHGRSSSNFES